MSDLVSIRAAFERLPAGVKGAFVLRGADGEPHQVRIERARVTEMAGRGSHAITVEPAILEVAPTLDTFVPFEFAVMDLDAGWYRLECEVVVDGTPSVVHPGKRFSVSWPRTSVRRGTVSIGKKTGDAKLVQLECSGDHLTVTYEAPAAAAGLKLTADGAQLPVLEHDHDADAGRGTVTAYPALRTQHRLTIELKGADGVQVRLP